jgi:hypothetical protein
MKARPKATVTLLTKWLGRRGGSWYNMGVIAPAQSHDYTPQMRDNHLGFRTVLNHRATVTGAP